jgi:hypothetical protein
MDSRSPREAPNHSKINRLNLQWLGFKSREMPVGDASEDK